MSAYTEDRTQQGDPAGRRREALREFCRVLNVTEDHVTPIGLRIAATRLLTDLQHGRPVTREAVQRLVAYLAVAADVIEADEWAGNE